MSVPEWVKPGAECFVYGTRGGARDPFASRSTIKSVGKKYVVMDSGARFPVDTLKRRGASAWDSDSTLRAPDDPRVLAVLARNRRINASRNVEDLMRKWRDGDDDALAQAVEILSRFA